MCSGESQNGQYARLAGGRHAVTVFSIPDNQVYVIYLLNLLEKPLGIIRLCLQRSMVELVCNVYNWFRVSNLPNSAHIQHSSLAFKTKNVWFTFCSLFTSMQE